MARRSASRRAALEKQTTALARRISEEGARAAATLVQLAEEAKTNAGAVDLLNRELAEEEQLFPADHLARHRDPTAREDLEEKTVDLWVFERTGELVGDQDAVRAHSYERGIIPAIGVSLNSTPVVRQRFRQITYREAGEREWVEPLASVLRLPRFDAPGMLFDHGHAVEPTPRRELVELIPDASRAKLATEAA